MARAAGSRLARILLPLSRHLRDTPLRLRARDVDRDVDAALGIHRRTGSELVDGRARHPVRPSLRALPASDPVSARPQPLWPAGADEHPAVVGAARGTASLLQHDRFHPDDDRHVLPHVPVSGRRQAAAVHVRVAPRAHARVLTIALILNGAVCASMAAGCRSDPSEQIDAEWTLDPSPPVVGSDVFAHVTLRDGAKMPVVGATLRLEGQMSHPGMAPVISNLTERGGGVYDAHLKLTMAGDWTLVLTGDLANGVRITKQLDLPGVRGATE